MTNCSCRSEILTSLAAGPLIGVSWKLRFNHSLLVQVHLHPLSLSDNKFSYSYKLRTLVIEIIYYFMFVIII